MNRVLQCDLDSDMMTVTLCAILDAARANQQSVLIAPTELLAEAFYADHRRPDWRGLRIVGTGFDGSYAAEPHAVVHPRAANLLYQRQPAHGPC